MNEINLSEIKKRYNSSLKLLNSQTNRNPNYRTKRNLKRNGTTHIVPNNYLIPTKKYSNLASNSKLPILSQNWKKEAKITNKYKFLAFNINRYKAIFQSREYFNYFQNSVNNLNNQKNNEANSCKYEMRECFSINKINGSKKKSRSIITNTLDNFRIRSFNYLSRNRYFYLNYNQQSGNDLIFTIIRGCKDNYNPEMAIFLKKKN